MGPNMPHNPAASMYGRRPWQLRQAARALRDPPALDLGFMIMGVALNPVAPAPARPARQRRTASAACRRFTELTYAQPATATQ